MRTVLLRALIVTLTVAAPVAAAAQEPGPPTLRAWRLGTTDVVHVDGVPDEPVWSQVEAADVFLQRDPDNGAAATERTEYRPTTNKKSSARTKPLVA